MRQENLWGSRENRFTSRGEMKNSTLLCVGSVCGGTVLQSVHGGEEI